MTRKEFDIINMINIEGIDNGQYGLIDYQVEVDKFFGVEECQETIPPCIYIYFNNDDLSAAKFAKLCDRKYPLKGDECIMVFFIKIDE